MNPAEVYREGLLDEMAWTHEVGPLNPLAISLGYDNYMKLLDEEYERVT